MPNQPAKHNRAKRVRISNQQAKRVQGKRLHTTSSKYWRAEREQQLSIHPFCKHCKILGDYTAAGEVDHVNGSADRAADYTPENYQSLCKPCHSRKSLGERGTIDSGEYE